MGIPGGGGSPSRGVYADLTGLPALLVRVFVTRVVGSLPEFLAKSDEYVYKLADNLLDALTNGEHSRTLKETEPVSKGSATTTAAATAGFLNLPFFFLSFQQQVGGGESPEAKNDAEVKVLRLFYYWSYEH